MSHVILDSLLPGDVIFDIGANTGDKSFWFVDKGLFVVCVEPQPEMAKILSERFGDNEKVIIRQVGVGRKKGFLDMFISKESPTLSTFAPHWSKGRFAENSWNETEKVEIITLDDLIIEFGTPRYCKIDVEGYEREVINGLSMKIGIISYEFTNEYMDHALEVLRKLIKLGYTKFNLSIAENPGFHFPQWVEYFEIASVLSASRLNGGLWGDIYAN